MEADLQRWYGLDYRDRWHGDRHRRITLRRLYVLVRHLPAEATVARIGRTTPIWTVTDYLLADIWSLLTKKGRRHPARPSPARAQHAPSQQLIEAARARAARRRRLIADGAIT